MELVLGTVFAWIIYKEVAHNAHNPEAGTIAGIVAFSLGATAAALVEAKITNLIITALTFWWVIPVLGISWIVYLFLRRRSQSGQKLPWQ